MLESMRKIFLVFLVVYSSCGDTPCPYKRYRTISCNTYCDFGTLGVLARDAACRDKSERCVLHEIQVVEERCVPLFEAKRKIETLACKLRVSC